MDRGADSTGPRRDTVVQHELPRSARPYSGIALQLYDLFVLRFTSPYAWGCHRKTISALYAEHCTTVHAEVGVGSGYFLSQLGKTWDKLALVDPNDATLAYAGARLGQGRLTGEQPRIAGYVADILVSDDLPPSRYKSVAANYLIHCLPGPMPAKEPAVANLARMTDAEGTLFGATVIGTAQHNRLGRILMWACNRTGAFGNTTDTEEMLRDLLERHFSVVTVWRENAVALFVASSPRHSEGS